MERERTQASHRKLGGSAAEIVRSSRLGQYGVYHIGMRSRPAVRVEQLFFSVLIARPFSFSRLVVVLFFCSRKAEDCTLECYYKVKRAAHPHPVVFAASLTQMLTRKQFARGGSARCLGRIDTGRLDVLSHFCTYLVSCFTASCGLVASLVHNFGSDQIEKSFCRWVVSRLETHSAFVHSA